MFLLCCCCVESKSQTMLIGRVYYPFIRANLEHDTFYIMQLQIGGKKVVVDVVDCRTTHDVGYIGSQCSCRLLYNKIYTMAQHILADSLTYSHYTANSRLRTHSRHTGELIERTQRLYLPCVSQSLTIYLWQIDKRQRTTSAGGIFSCITLFIRYSREAYIVYTLRTDIHSPMLTIHGYVKKT